MKAYYVMFSSLDYGCEMQARIYNLKDEMLLRINFDFVAQQEGVEEYTDKITTTALKDNDELPYSLQAKIIARVAELLEDVLADEDAALTIPFEVEE